MLKTASLTVRVKPDTKTRLDNLARVTRRSMSYLNQSKKALAVKTTLADSRYA